MPKSGQNRLMLRESVWKELAQNLLTIRFATCVVLSLILVIFGTLVGSQEYHQRLAEYSGLVTREQEKLADVRVYSHLKPVIAKKPNPLLIFNRGYVDQVGNEVQISHRSVPFLASGAGVDNEMLILFPTFDLIDVVRYVLGLLALLLSFDAISAERESGTLKLVLSNAISRTRVALAKYEGGVLSLLIPLAVSFLIALLFLHLFSPIGLSGEDWLRILIALADAALYLSAMLLVGLCLSSMSRR